MTNFEHEISGPENKTTETNNRAPEIIAIPVEEQKRKFLMSEHKRWRDETYSKNPPLSPSEMASSFMVFATTGLNIAALQTDEGKTGLIEGLAISQAMSGFQGKFAMAKETNQPMDYSSNDTKDFGNYLNEGSRLSANLVSEMRKNEDGSKPEETIDEKIAKERQKEEEIAKIEKKFHGSGNENSKSLIIGEIDEFLNYVEMAEEDKKEIAEDILHIVSLEIFNNLKQTNQIENLEMDGRTYSLSELNPENKEDLVIIWKITKKTMENKDMTGEVRNATSRVLNNWLTQFQSAS